MFPRRFGVCLATIFVCSRKESCRGDPLLRPKFPPPSDLAPEIRDERLGPMSRLIIMINTLSLNVEKWLNLGEIERVFLFLFSEFETKFGRIGASFRIANSVSWIKNIVQDNWDNMHADKKIKKRVCLKFK